MKYLQVCPINVEGISNEDLVLMAKHSLEDGYIVDLYVRADGSLRLERYKAGKPELHMSAQKGKILFKFVDGKMQVQDVKI